MSQVRVAVVQLTCHPSFTIGGRDYASEPFLEGSEPILSRLARSMDVTPIRDLCREEYRKFHDLRVANALQWIAKRWDRENLNDLERDDSVGGRRARTLPTHIVAFPEGSIRPEQVGRIIVPFVKFQQEKRKRFITVLAGTHAFHACDESLAVYPKFIHDKTRNPFLDLAENKIKDSRLPDNEADREVEIASRRKIELQRIKQDDGYDAKSVLPIVHYDGSVSLRLKQMPSPFERTNTAQRGRRQLSKEQRDQRKPQIFHSLEIYNCGKHNSDHTLKPDVSILPLVCSEALRLPDALEECEIVVILAYHRKPQDFMSLAQQARLNGKLVILANDGAFGGSGVFLTPDERAENWWFGEPNNGKLPAGDGILLVDVDLDHMSPELGRNNPQSPNGIVAIAAIVPGHARSFETQVSETTLEIQNAVQSSIDSGELQLKCPDLVSRVRSLVNSSKVGPIQQLKLWRIRELLQLHNLAPDRASVLCEDAKILKGRERITFLPEDTQYEAPQGEELSLRELESRLAWETIQFLEHESSIANEKGMLHDASDLVAVKRLLESRRGRTSATSPLTNVLRALSQNRDDAVATARSWLSRRLGIIVERFGGTSGWIFLVRDNARNRNPSHSAEQKEKRRSESKEEKERQLCNFFPVAAYNAPELFIDRDVREEGSGIVGRVAFSKKPYLANDVTHKLHSGLYIADVPSTRSELTVPLTFNGKLLGVLNIEANYKNAFSTFDVNTAISEGARLIPDLLVLEASESAEELTQWHPLRHGWQLTPYLDSLCDSIAKALPTQHGSPSIGCSVWALDASKESVSILGTARFDFEYVAERTLGAASSHIGNAILALLKESQRNGKEYAKIVPEGSRLEAAIKSNTHSVSYYEECRLVSDLPSFKRKRKAQRMELRTITVFPFFVRSGDEGTPPVACAMVLYGFEHEWGVRGVSLNQMFTPTVGHNLVAELSSAIFNFFRQKSRIAAAHLSGRMCTDPTAARNPMETVKQVFQEVFATHGSTIFVKNQKPLPIRGSDDKGHLSLVATTGITPVGPSASADWRSYPLYPLGESEHHIKRAPTAESTPDIQGDPERISYYIGLTNFLGLKAGAIVRKADALDIEEPVIFGDTHEAVYLAPRNSLLESFAPGANEHMRFLGASVADHPDKNADDPDKNVVGVIRLTRTGTASPFNVFDEFVMRAMCWTIAPVFVDRQAFMRVPFDSWPLTSTISIASNEPLAELAAEISQTYGSAFHHSLGASFANVANFLSTVVNASSPMVDHLHKALLELIPYFRPSPEATKSRLPERVPQNKHQTIQEFLGTLHQLMAQWGQAASTLDQSLLRRRLLLRSCVELRSAVILGTVLEDLNALCRSILSKQNDPSSNPTVLSSIRCVQDYYSDDGLSSAVPHLRVLAVQPAWTSQKPDEDFRDALPRPRTSSANGWKVVDAATGNPDPPPLSYRILKGAIPTESFHRMHPHSAAVRSGVCMPFFVSMPDLGNHCGDISREPILCILSVDFALNSEEFSDTLVQTSILPSMLLAVDKLKTVLSVDFSTHPLAPAMGFGTTGESKPSEIGAEVDRVAEAKKCYEQLIATKFVKQGDGDRDAEVAIQFWERLHKE